MATNFSPCKGSYVLNQFPSNVMFGMNEFHVSASGAIQGHHSPLVSSPEHNVLRGSYCDRSSSGVRPSVRASVHPSVRPSVNNFFKNLLLQNQTANLDKTWQECSLGEAVQKC